MSTLESRHVRSVCNPEHSHESTRAFTGTAAVALALCVTAAAMLSAAKRRRGVLSFFATAASHSEIFEKYVLEPNGKKHFICEEDGLGTRLGCASLRGRWNRERSCLSLWSGVACGGRDGGARE